MTVSDATRPCTLRELLGYFVRLGSLGFGGPIALAGYMQRDLVEDRRWISKQDYVEGLALAQLAMYLGWVRAGALGATLVSVAFILPSFLMVLALSALYVHYGGLPWMQDLFYGIGAAVIAILLRSVSKLAQMTLRRDWLLVAIAAASAVVTAATESEIVWLFLAAGVVALLVKAPPTLRRPPLAALAPWSAGALVVHGPASAALIWKLGLYFAKAGTFVFGSGLAIVPFLHAGVVNDFHWLSERQFLDAVAVAMITPGPVVITVAFIGYLVAGLAGAGAAALGVFLPCYLFVIVPAPYFRRFAGNRSIKAFVDGVSAAATGAIGGAAFVLGRRALVDLPTVAIGLTTLMLLIRIPKLPEPILILGAGLVGVLMRGVT